MKKILSVIFFCLILLFLPRVSHCSEIHEAAKKGDVVKLREILDREPSLLTTKDEIGKTPLHWAAGKNQLEVIKVLLDEYHIDVNIRNANNGTPLHVAASQANPQAVLILIEHGAEIDARTLNNSTPLHFAIIKSGKPGHIEAAKILIEHGADVNAKTDDGVTPLTMALFRRNTEISDLLKSKGAKPGTSKTRGGRSNNANPYMKNYFKDR
ncbi:MAG: hypothetical protein A2267_01975 [Omnitrophica WOR_2 bacterium RIFOXYA12_FULL_38_10]|nr:MAG: hypothetical protein A2267_01975 [Omnitrophica WOR_2 bacterium RIFOXYA12_FULL_38_10]